MKGAERLLKEGRVDVLSFEYGDKWTTETRQAMYGGVKVDIDTHKPEEPSLPTAVKFLADRGMDVFYLGESVLLPVSGPFWTPRLQICLAPDLYGLANGNGSGNNCWFDLIAIRRTWPGRKALIEAWVHF
jgi:hypothetical protein